MLIDDFLGFVKYWNKNFFKSYAPKRALATLQRVKLICGVKFAFIFLGNLIFHGMKIIKNCSFY